MDTSRNRYILEMLTFRVSPKWNRTVTCPKWSRIVLRRSFWVVQSSKSKVKTHVRANESGMHARYTLRFTLCKRLSRQMSPERMQSIAQAKLWVSLFLSLSLSLSLSLFSCSFFSLRLSHVPGTCLVGCVLFPAKTLRACTCTCAHVSVCVRTVLLP